MATCPLTGKDPICGVGTGVTQPAHEMPSGFLVCRAGLRKASCWGGMAAVTGGRSATLESVPEPGAKYGGLRERAATTEPKLLKGTP